jgi:TIP41-like family
LVRVKLTHCALYNVQVLVRLCRREWHAAFTCNVIVWQAPCSHRLNWSVDVDMSRLSCSRSEDLLCRTYTTDYTGTVTGGSKNDRSTDWATTAVEFDRQQLLERAAILFSAEVPLFETELDDNGVAACSVRVRIQVHQSTASVLATWVVIALVVTSNIGPESGDINVYSVAWISSWMSRYIERATCCNTQSASR